MKEYIKFLKDKSLLFAVAIILLIEISMQFGWYKYALKKNSYASNVNRITDHAISKSKELDPDILIIGTSIAYEGISLKLLNENLKTVGLTAQSVAIPGAELIIQQLAVEKALEEFKNVKYLIHLNEAETPWTLGGPISIPTLAMAGEFDRLKVYSRFKEHDYSFNLADTSYLLFKLWAYRHDLAEFILNPGKRIKTIGRSRKKFQDSLYSYENTNIESLELYPFKNLEEALELTKPTAPISDGSNDFHKEAIYKTCRLAKETTISIEENASTELFKKRLSSFYSVLRARKIKIINVFPPFSIYLEHFRHPERIQFWKEKYGNILGEKTLDLSHSIPEERNGSYFYDIVHPNEKGMKLFTKELSKSILEIIKDSGKDIK